jgi:hypothetical protein
VECPDGGLVPVKLTVPDRMETLGSPELDASRRARSGGASEVFGFVEAWAAEYRRACPSVPNNRPNRVVVIAGGADEVSAALETTRGGQSGWNARGERSPPALDHDATREGGWTADVVGSPPGRCGLLRTPRSANRSRRPGGGVSAWASVRERRVQARGWDFRVAALIGGRIGRSAVARAPACPSV